MNHEKRGISFPNHKKLRSLGSTGFSLSLFVRGEFNLRSSVLLISIYGAAILCIPLLLNSLFGIAALISGVSEYSFAQQILASIFIQAQSSYSYVVIVLASGFIVAGFLSGRSFAKSSVKLVINILHNGGDLSRIFRTVALLLSLVALSSTILAFSLSLAITSGALYLAFAVFKSPYLLPSLSLSYDEYLFLVFFMSISSLIFGAISELFLGTHRFSELR